MLAATGVLLISNMAMSFAYRSQEALAHRATEAERRAQHKRGNEGVSKRLAGVLASTFHFSISSSGTDTTGDVPFQSRASPSIEIARLVRFERLRDVMALELWQRLVSTYRALAEVVAKARTREDEPFARRELLGPLGEELVGRRLYRACVQ